MQLLLFLCNDLFILFRGLNSCPQIFNSNAADHCLCLDLIGLQTHKFLPGCLNICQYLDSFSQIFYFIFDLPVRIQLFTNRGNGIGSVLWKHIITNKLPRSIGHFQGNCTFFHRDKTVLINIPENHIIQSSQICLFGTINAVDFSLSAVVIGFCSDTDQLFDLLIGIADALFRQIFRLRHFPGVTEIHKFFNLRIWFSYFKRNSNTGCNMGSGIFNFQSNDGTEITVFTIGRSVFLFSAQIT